MSRRGYPHRIGRQLRKGGRSVEARRTVAPREFGYKSWMHLDAGNPLLPIVTLAAGVFLLIAPRIVSVAVAVYLIVVGLVGLNGIYHIFK